MEDFVESELTNNKYFLNSRIVTTRFQFQNSPEVMLFEVVVVSNGYSENGEKVETSLRVDTSPGPREETIGSSVSETQVECETDVLAS